MYAYKAIENHRKTTSNGYMTEMMLCKCNRDECEVEGERCEMCLFKMVKDEHPRHRLGRISDPNFIVSGIVACLVSI